MALTCKKCSLEGNVDLAQGKFKVGDADNILDHVNNTVEFFQHGAIELDVNDMFAIVELGLEFDASAELLSYSVPLPSIPITPFTVSIPHGLSFSACQGQFTKLSFSSQIPGVVEFGIILTPQILVDVQLNDAVEFSYGFNLSVRIATQAQ